MKKNENLMVIGNDIPYQDGVIDVLKSNSELEILILSKDLIGEYKLEEFLKKIISITNILKIILIEDEIETINIKDYEKYKIEKVFINNENLVQNIINYFKENNNNLELNTQTDLMIEIEKLKNIIAQSQGIDITKNSKFKLLKNRSQIKYKKQNKVIAITGNYGSGKSMITAMLGKASKILKIRTLMIDFDVINNSLNTLFRVNRYNYNNKEETIDNYIVSISNNLDLFTGIDMLFTEENKISFENVKKLLEKMKIKYDLILIDTSSETSLRYIKTVLANVDKIIFLIEPNILELKKSQKLLEIYIEEWEVPIKKFFIILNKVNINSIDEELIKNILGNLKIVEKIRFSNKYTTIANDIRAGVNLSKYVQILSKIED